MWNMMVKLSTANTDVADKILCNKKRMEKLENMHDGNKKLKKLDGYVTAACREVGVKLTDAEKDATVDYICLGHRWF